MAGEEKPSDKGFTVKDRRRFSPETGEPRAEAETESETPQTAAEPSTKAEAGPRQAGEPLPEINFSTFIISLSTQALMHLGEIANPMTGQVEKDTPMAKQVIDILGMLRDKARGNLDTAEDKLIQDILFDLRMRYVEAVKRK